MHILIKGHGLTTLYGDKTALSNTSPVYDSRFPAVKPWLGRAGHLPPTIIIAHGVHKRRLMTLIHDHRGRTRAHALRSQRSECKRLLKQTSFPVNYCDLGTRQCNKMSIHYSTYVDESSESALLIESS